MLLVVLWIATFRINQILSINVLWVSEVTPPPSVTWVTLLMPLSEGQFGMVGYTHEFVI